MKEEKRANPLGKPKCRKDGSIYYVPSYEHRKMINSRLRSLNITIEEWRKKFNPDFIKATDDMYDYLILKGIITNHPDQKDMIMDEITQHYEEMFIRAWSIFMFGSFTNRGGEKELRDKDTYLFPPSPGGFMAYGKWGCIKNFVFSKSIRTMDHDWLIRDNTQVAYDPFEVESAASLSLDLHFYNIVIQGMTPDEAILWDLWWRRHTHKEMAAILGISTRVIDRKMASIYMDIEVLLGINRQQIKRLRSTSMAS